MDDLNIGDIILCIANLTNYKPFNSYVGKMGKVINPNYNNTYIISCNYDKPYNKLIRVELYDNGYLCEEVFVQEEIIKICGGK